MEVNWLLTYEFLLGSSHLKFLSQLALKPIQFDDEDVQFILFWWFCTTVVLDNKYYAFLSRPLLAS